jgi:diguanylate cyclase (GGDEF)-like protein
VVTVISRFRVRNGLEEEVRAAFVNRPRLVEKAGGFRGLEVLTDATDPSIFLLLTRWTDKESFRSWHGSEAHRQSHELMPRGLKLDSSFTSLTIGNSVDDASGVQFLGDAIEGQTVPISQWLMECEAIYALLLAPDGSIRARNRASQRVFPPDPEKNTGLSVWDFVVCSDAQQLRERLADSQAAYSGTLMLNVSDGQHREMTLNIVLIQCSGAVLLLGTADHRHDSGLQAEMVKQANDLAVLMREVSRKNRELAETNEIIDRLARTDALTGLANRRTLFEALRREIVRTERLGEGFSLIIIDLDQFKSINDEYGHLIGDQVLVSAAAVFASQLRPYDLAARYGGEEFVLLLPGTSQDQAAVVAERVRNAISKLEVGEYPRGITVSLGAACWMTGETAEETIARADKALYRAKQSGRNRVEVAASVRK